MAQESARASIITSIRSYQLDREPRGAKSAGSLRGRGEREGVGTPDIPDTCGSVTQAPVAVRSGAQGGQGL